MSSPQTHSRSPTPSASRSSTNHDPTRCPSKVSTPTRPRNTDFLNTGDVAFASESDEIRRASAQTATHTSSGGIKHTSLGLNFTHEAPKASIDYEEFYYPGSTDPEPMSGSGTYSQGRHQTFHSFPHPHAPGNFTQYTGLSGGPPPYSYAPAQPWGAIGQYPGDPVAFGSAYGWGGHPVQPVSSTSSYYAPLGQPHPDFANLAHSAPGRRSDQQRSTNSISARTKAPGYHLIPIPCESASGDGSLVSNTTILTPSYRAVPNGHRPEPIFFSTRHPQTSVPSVHPPHSDSKHRRHHSSTGKWPNGYQQSQVHRHSNAATSAPDPPRLVASASSKAITQSTRRPQRPNTVNADDHRRRRDKYPDPDTASSALGSSIQSCSSTVDSSHGQEKEYSGITGEDSHIARREARRAEKTEDGRPGKLVLKVVHYSRDSQ